MNIINDFIYFLHYTGKNIPKTPVVKIDFYHLTFVLEGTFTYLADGKEYIVKENDALLLVPGTLRQRLYIPEKVRYVIINYPADNQNSPKTNVFFKNGINQPIRNFLKACPCDFFEMITPNTTPSAENKKTTDILLNLFNCILIELFDSLQNPPKSEIIKKALEFINNNTERQLSLEDVCKSIHLSKSYTTRLFRKEMNMTVTDYINRQKLELSKSLLADNTLSLQEVSSRVGYNNYCYFSKIFKKQYGVSPIDMRKRL